MNPSIQSTLLALLLGPAAIGCSGTDPGSGSNTLFANVEIAGREDSTQIEVELKLRGNPVVGANVVATDDDSGVAATLEGPSAGIYKGRLMGYAQTIALKITSGEDELEAQLE